MEATLAPEKVLTAADRCDRCGSRAYVRATLATGDLYFCGHHGRKYEVSILPLTLSWLDESQFILED